MALRKHDRVDFSRQARWDFFAEGTGSKTGSLINISKTGCLLKTAEPIEHQRWLRIMVRDSESNLHLSLVGKIVRCENRLEAYDPREEVTLYRYGIQFTYPAVLSDQDFDLILALSSRNFKVRSWRSRNSKSSLRPGFLA